VESLARRRASGLSGFNVVSCDNIRANGQLAKRIVIDLAAIRDAALAEWIEREVRFPSTMVDRITPATTNADIERLAAQSGYYDAACVTHEPFRQWVIEDNFVGSRPAWEQAGAQFVASVEDYELMKLRCLNGTHSALAYLGYLAGYETIAETVADPVIADFCRYLWQAEITPTVPQPEGQDLDVYCASLFERYRNRAVKHRTWQIAMDGSQKLPQRLLFTVQDNLAAGRIPYGLCLAIAAWMRYVSGGDEHGKAIADGSAATVDALLGIHDIFPIELKHDERFRNTLILAHECLVTHGARDSIARCLRDVMPTS
jgi:fructuronate reductase